MCTKRSPRASICRGGGKVAGVGGWGSLAGWTFLREFSVAEHLGRYREEQDWRGCDADLQLPQAYEGL